MFLESFLQRELLTTIAILRAEVGSQSGKYMRIARFGWEIFSRQRRSIERILAIWRRLVIETSNVRVSCLSREHARWNAQRRGEHVIHNLLLVNVRLESGVFAVPFRNSVPVRLMRNGFLTFLRKRASVRTAKCGVAAHKIRESGARSSAHRLLPCAIPGGKPVERST